jgi:hypothetical protein
MGVHKIVKQMEKVDLENQAKTISNKNVYLWHRIKIVMDIHL